MYMLLRYNDPALNEDTNEATELVLSMFLLPSVPYSLLLVQTFTTISWKQS